MDVVYCEEYITNSRGVELFTCRWLPISSPKALVFLCHGYGMECSNFMKGVGIKLSNHGYAVFGIDYEGHGQSSGARCYIKRFDNIVNDCSEHFKSVCAREEYKEKRRFLYGESMGGAVALLTHKNDPNFWDGAVLVAPMCKISEKVKPHPIIISLLTRVEDVIPKWKIVPTKDVIDSAFKDPVKREEVTLPFLVLHGEADTVTDPEVSKGLYEQASSVDKTMKIYAGMWHGLTSGEPDDNIEIVFSDILAWLDKRSGEDAPRPSLDPTTTTTTTTAPAEQTQCEIRPNAKNSHGWKGLLAVGKSPFLGGSIRPEKMPD
ncbi:caffeoylshikimate esterase-like isoform X2 [Salvia miltiorrhiza]|uniref:caffeoylshikimate esterase-like isoform X2 n=1 Tax=Salvia miltiorrhiza TaxID=226208 RepID=UPI0025AC91D5|nr:caffeoylshikimate esterase-like isoform X2 [Salvia miltiorrhiza]XP_057776618.1 caffeoylshikimate esterase-like isoform X2 [Salvia miltiorrhiza]XP_057776619.1 caffeoylshikimate esterase-like isoform X2 [Salvia miltiorrhiza]